jgi:hypothetical protein
MLAGVGAPKPEQQSEGEADIPIAFDGPTYSPAGEIYMSALPQSSGRLRCRPEAASVGHFAVLIEGAVMPPYIANVDANRHFRHGQSAWDFLDEVLRRLSRDQYTTIAHPRQDRRSRK